jgi:hypothetical protein
MTGRTAIAPGMLRRISDTRYSTFLHGTWGKAAGLPWLKSRISSRLLRSYRLAGPNISSKHAD